MADMPTNKELVALMNVSYQMVKSLTGELLPLSRISNLLMQEYGVIFKDIRKPKRDSVPQVELQSSNKKMSMQKRQSNPRKSKPGVVDIANSEGTESIFESIDEDERDFMFVQANDLDRESMQFQIQNEE